MGASFVQDRLVAHSSVEEAPAYESAPEYEHVYLLTVSRNPKELHKCLHEGPELETIRASLKQAGHASLLSGSGAGVFVAPNHYEAVRSLLERKELRPYHVVVSETFIELVYEAIRAIPSRRDV